MKKLFHSDRIVTGIDLTGCGESKMGALCHKNNCVKNILIDFFETLSLDLGIH